MTAAEWTAIESVVSFYADKDTIELSVMSHSKAWEEARRGMSKDEKSQEESTELLHARSHILSAPPESCIPKDFSMEKALSAVAEIEKTWGGLLALLATR